MLRRVKLVPDCGAAPKMAEGSFRDARDQRTPARLIIAESFHLVTSTLTGMKNSIFNSPSSFHLYVQ